jgi:hypothetical protein
MAESMGAAFTGIKQGSQQETVSTTYHMGYFTMTQRIQIPY